MSKTATVAGTSVTVTGDGVGLVYTIPGLPSVNTLAPDPIQNVAMTTGANTVTVPAGAQYVVIVPPVGSVVSMKLKGDTADIGVTLATNRPSIMSLSSSTSSFVLTLGSGQTVQLCWA